MDANIAVTQFTAAAVFVWAMERLKAAAWFPFLQKEGQVWLKRTISIVTAFGVHTGIAHVWNPGAVPGSHQLIIEIPPLMIILTGLWHWLGQYAMQETMYQATVNKTVVVTKP